MPDIVIWGGTGQAKVVAEALTGTQFQIVAVFDNRVLPSPLRDVPMHHGQSQFRDWLTKRRAASDTAAFFVVAIGGGNGRARLEIGAWLAEQGLFAATIVHPRAWIAGDAAVGVGSQILAGALIGAQARLGCGVIVNTGASIDHDCVIADGVHVGPGAVVAGEVIVETCAFVGAGATVLPGRRIGADAIVGAGSVVTRDVEAGTVVVGNPARVVGRVGETDAQDDRVD